jgi:uncharacterized protein (UPF0332 family)
LTDKDAILVYFEGARDALESAQFNFDNGYYGVAINRAYYAYFYAATAMLMTLDLTRSKHSGVMAAFREHFVKTGLFSVEDSWAYGEAYELRNTTDYEMLGKADESEARTVVENAGRFIAHCETYLTAKGDL